MKISDLIKILQKHKRKSGDLEVICTRCSDYTTVDETDVNIVRAVSAVNNVEWVTRYHETMPADQRARAKDYLHFDGN